MIYVYINYPNPKIKIHRNLETGQYQKHNKLHQRVIEINFQSLGIELGKFRKGEYRFASNEELNDMWLKINLSNEETEREVLLVIQNYIGGYHHPLSSARINIE